MDRLLIFHCILKTKLPWHIFSDLTWSNLKAVFFLRNMCGYVMRAYYIVFVRIPYQGKFRRRKSLSPSHNLVIFPRRKVLPATATI